MDDTVTPQPDPVDDLLRPNLPPPDDRLRHELLVRTTRLLRRRRRLRYLTIAAAMAACYLAGVLTVRLGTAPEDGPGRGDLARDSTGPKQDQTVRPKRAPRPPVRPEKESPPRPDVQVAVKDLEWHAFESTDRARRFELYRRAGDRYLAESNDVQSAIRCYRGALDAASEKDRTISVNDNWVLMAVKQERQKEKLNAQNGG
jgi:hypothetical protein